MSYRRQWFSEEENGSTLDDQQRAKVEAELPTLIGNAQLGEIAAAAKMPWSGAELGIRRADIVAWKAESRKRTTARASAILICRKRALKAKAEAEQMEAQLGELTKRIESARARERNEQYEEEALIRLYQREDLSWEIEEHTIEYHTIHDEAKKDFTERVAKKAKSTK